MSLPTAIDLYSYRYSQVCDMSSSISEEKERELVAKVELRFALADSPDKFQQGLDTFVAPLLLKLASPHASVRQAVFNVLKDILARLNSLREVKVPVEKLVLQAQNPGIPPNQEEGSVRLYSLLLASKGIERLSTSEARSIVPLTMRKISRLPRTTAARMFHVLCKLLLKWIPPLKGSKEEDETREFLALDDDKDLSFWLNKFTQFFLLQPAKPDQESGVIPRGYSCPGLCSDDVSFFTYEAGVSFTKEQMLRFKTAIYKFTTNGLVKDDYMLLRFLSVVSADSSSLSESAAQLLKRLNTPYEDANFINFMIELYTGNRTTGAPPVKHELQERILGVLNRSVIATSDPTQVSRLCSIGIHSTYHKLRSLSLVFVRHVAKHNYESLVDQSEVSVGIAPLLRNNLHEEGWPRLQLGSSTANFGSTIKLRRLQYETLGDILRMDPNLLVDLSYIEFLMDSLKGDLPEFRPSIQEALVSLTVPLSRVGDSSKEQLRVLVRRVMSDDYEIEMAENKEIREAIMACRYVCIKYCNSVFSFDDAEARMINVWGTSRTNKFDVIEEAYKGLNPYWFRVNQALNVADSKSARHLLTTRVHEVGLPTFESFATLILNELKTAAAIQSSSIFKTLNVAVRFCKQCLISEAVRGLDTIVLQDEDWSVRIEKALDVDELVQQRVSKVLSDIYNDWLTGFLCLLGDEFLIKDGEGTTLRSFHYEDPIFGETLLSLIRYCNTETLRSLEIMVSRIYNYLGAMAVNKPENLEIAANTLGIIAANIPHSKCVNDILTTIVSAPNSRLSPSLLANSYIVPRMMLRDVSEVQTSTVFESLAGKLMSLFGSKQRDNLVLKCLGQITKFGSLNETPEKFKSEFLRQCINYLQNKLSNNPLAAEVWSYLSMYTRISEGFASQLEELFETHVCKHVDFLFSAGEALSIMAGGWRSSFLERQLDIFGAAQSKMRGMFDDEKLHLVVDRVFQGCDSTKPSLRKAACIWLLSLVQFLKREGEISRRSSEIHLRFIRFLAVRDEFIQETAARGLSLIYEIGDVELKEGMIKGLLKSFTDSKNTNSMTAGSVSGETELFDADMLKTNDGSIRTYQDILNLSSEVGDPSLVYKFMSLSKSSLLWSSKKGIAFGLGAIMSKSSLLNLLIKDQSLSMKLIPKLFRYRFDPYPAVARSMNDIWGTLIVDPPAVISEYFNQILKELLSGMGNKEWRVREASTMAMLQLVQSQPRDTFETCILDIWTMAFRAMDDIKESVREASTKLTTGLSKILARSINVTEGVKPESATKILKQILPFFLGAKGINSDAEEVRNYAMKVLLELIKNSGDATKSFAVQLVYEFTLLFSAVEPQAMNFLSLNANNYKIDSDAIDLYRKTSIDSSPLMEAIRKLVTISDDSMAEEHSASAIRAAKNSVGLPSKAAASTVFILLVKKYHGVLMPSSGKLLKSCVHAFSDRNLSVRIAFATAFGHIFHIAPLEKAVKYAKQLSDRFFSGDIDDRIVVGTAIESALKYAPLEFERVSSIFMPLLFFGSNDDEKKTTTLYESIWTEASNSGAGTVKLYLEEILHMLKQHIGSPNFSIRRTCGKSISVLCNKVDQSTGDKLVDQLFSITLEALSGRSWEGKELILEALQSLAVKFKDHLRFNNELRTALSQAFDREISRKNESYVSKAIFPYFSFLSVFPQPESVTKLIDITDQLLHKSVGGPGKMGNDETPSSEVTENRSDIGRKSSRKNIEEEDSAIRLLKGCARVCKSMEKREEQRLILMSFILAETMKLFNHNSILYTWRSQVAACEIGQELVDSISATGHDPKLNALLSKFWSTVFECNGTTEAIENVKIQTIMLGVTLRKHIPELGFEIESNLRAYSELGRTSRVENELRNAGL